MVDSSPSHTIQGYDPFGRQATIINDNQNQKVETQRN